MQLLQPNVLLLYPQWVISSPSCAQGVLAQTFAAPVWTLCVLCPSGHWFPSCIRRPSGEHLTRPSRLSTAYTPFSTTRRCSWHRFLRWGIIFRPSNTVFVLKCDFYLSTSLFFYCPCCNRTFVYQETFVSLFTASVAQPGLRLPRGAHHPARLPGPYSHAGSRSVRLTHEVHRG